MRRILVSLCVCAAALLVGCEQPKQVPGPPPTGAEKVEQPEAQPKEASEEPEADESDQTGAESPPEAGDTAPSAEADGCPPARTPEGMCAQVIAWAKNPDTGKCCEYPTPCEAPKDWKTFSSRDECEK